MPLREFKVVLPSNWNKDMFMELQANVSWNRDGTANVSCDKNNGIIRSFIARNKLTVLDIVKGMHIDDDKPVPKIKKQDIE